MAPLPLRQKRRKSPELIFVSTAGVVCLFALYSLIRQDLNDALRPAPLQARSLLQKQDLECRFVHDAKDKCAFIKANCPDEEAGLLSYLSLYYCSLSHAKPVGFTILIIWISLLFSTIGIAASDFLCINLSTIAAVLGMSESLTGVTFLAFGNGSPDVFSTFAAMKANSGSLAVGELMGAAGFITAVVSGSMAIIKPFRVARKSFVRDVSFFVVAASFSLVYLWDGSLKLWECASMVAFYVFYVVFVVVSHWYQQRNRRIRLAETAARLSHHIPEHQELEAPQIEVDEESQPANERAALLRAESGSSIPTLRTPGTPAWRARDQDEDEDAGERQLAELQSNMRVSRASHRDRRNTLTPIRPSLIGALEFRSILSALERKSTGQSIGLRRYSDDGSQGLNSAFPTTTPASVPPFDPYFDDVEAQGSRHTLPSGRNRTVSANDAQGLRIDHDLVNTMGSSPATVIYTPYGASEPVVNHRRSHSEMPRSSHLSPLSQAPQVLLSPISASSGASSPSTYTQRNGLLAPPNAGAFQQPDYTETEHSFHASPAVSPNMVARQSAHDVPVLQLPHPELRKSPLMSATSSPGQTPASSRPPSIRLPPASTSPESLAGVSMVGDEGSEPNELRHISWWPYTQLPPPQVILATLFPTLYNWRSKGFLDNVVGLLTVVPVFLLTITLPVVDAANTGASPDITVPVTPNEHGRKQSDVPIQLVPDIPPMEASMEHGVSNNRPHPHRQDTQQSGFRRPYDDTDGCDSGANEWNRWLVILQLFTAPLFVALIVWANLDEQHTIKELLLMTLGSLIFSLVGLLFLLIFTSADKEPTFRPILCFLGFAVAIAWISTIANEVVGVLKAFGVILNISDAILGLTIFAIGNSLGDLVADITVAKLGYPIMALSACLGGPMLNILLGIGMGGMYMTIQRGQHRHEKHPDRPIKYKPYELEVSTTLMISGVTLLVTLLGLLVVVPLNGWRMDRRVGIGLIALWSVSTIGNVICEVLGIGERRITTLST